MSSAQDMKLLVQNPVFLGEKRSNFCVEMRPGVSFFLAFEFCKLLDAYNANVFSNDEAVLKSIVDLFDKIQAIKDNSTKKVTMEVVVHVWKSFFCSHHAIKSDYLLLRFVNATLHIKFNGLAFSLHKDLTQVWTFGSSHESYFTPGGLSIC